MKHYAYILTILIICVVIGGCRSNRSLQSSSTTAIEANIKEQSTTTEDTQTKATTEVDSTTVENTASSEQTVSNSEKETELDEYEWEKSKATIYDKDGNVKAVIESERGRGRTDKATERAGSLHVSSESRSDTTATRMETHSETNIAKIAETDIDIEIQSNQQTNINETSSSDSRIVQGKEWLYVVIPIVVALLIYLIFRYVRSKKHSK